MKYSFLFFLAFLATASFAQNETGRISVNGSATLYAVPDEVLFSIDLVSTDKDIRIARQKGKENAQKVIQYLKDQKIAQEHIQTQRADLTPVYSDYKRREFLHYQSSQKINICIKDLNRFDDIIDGLLAMKIHSISQAEYRSLKYQELKDQVRILAVKDAQAKAKAMVEALGAQLGTPHRINEANTTQRFSAESYAVIEVDNSSDQKSFAVGQIAVSSKVEITFNIK